MNKKTILIGLGVLAVAGIGYYMWKKKSETTSGADSEEVSSSASGTKVCNCGYLKDEYGRAKPNKICSKSVRCNDCCEGAGTTGHTGSTV